MNNTENKTLIDVAILDSYLRELDNWRRISNVLGAFGVNREDLENNIIEIIQLIKNKKKENNYNNI